MCGKIRGREESEVEGEEVREEGEGRKFGRNVSEGN